MSHAEQLAAEVLHVAQQAEHFKSLWLRANDELDRLKNRPDVAVFDTERAEALVRSTMDAASTWVCAYSRGSWPEAAGASLATENTLRRAFGLPLAPLREPEQR